MVTTVFQTDRDRPIEWARAGSAEKIDEKQKNILNIWMERDGVVYINDQPHTMEQVTTVVAPLYAASERALVISIRATVRFRTGSWISCRPRWSTPVWFVWSLPHNWSKACRGRDDDRRSHTSGGSRDCE